MTNENEEFLVDFYGSVSRFVFAPVMMMTTAVCPALLIVYLIPVDKKPPTPWLTSSNITNTHIIKTSNPQTIAVNTLYNNLST